jgi:aminoglycoside phosphotransferase (APT) family kinase protein
MSEPDLAVADLLPRASRDAVAAAVASTFAAPIEGLSPLGGGLSGSLVYRMVVAGRAYLLRVAVTRDHFRDPRRHFACLKIAAQVELSPAVHHLDDQAGIAITDFIAAAPFAAMHRLRAELLVDLASAIRRLQAAPPFPPLVHWLDGLTALIAEVRQRAMLPPEAEELFGGHAAMAAAYPRAAQDQVSSHNDLNPGNIIWDGARLWLVDWEAAFLNDRYFDVASVCNWFTATPQDEELFLEAYLGAQPDRRQRARVHLMRQAAHLAFGLTMVRLGIEGGAGPVTSLEAAPLATVRREIVRLIGTADGKIRLGLATLGEVRSHLRDGAFTDSLRAVEK